MNTGTSNILGTQNTFRFAWENTQAHTHTHTHTHTCRHLHTNNHMHTVCIKSPKMDTKIHTYTHTHRSQTPS